LAFYEFRPYVSVAEKRRRIAREAAKRKKKGLAVEPVTIAGRAIAKTFWGKAWCDHLESYSDYANRLPRGRTYVRNGSVMHLAIRAGRIDALVQGSELYEVAVTVAPLARARWKAIVNDCAGEIDSLVELLRGRLSAGVMRVVTDRRGGLFPAPDQIALKCSCPDWASMCKHVAAVLYGIGARLDERPELLFTLRRVDHSELLSAGGVGPRAPERREAATIATGDLSEVFGIELDLGGGTNDAAPPSPDEEGGSRSGARKKTVRAKRAGRGTPAP
jgi:uncharacterized Zn finger protein